MHWFNYLEFWASFKYECKLSQAVWGRMRKPESSIAFLEGWREGRGASWGVLTQSSKRAFLTLFSQNFMMRKVSVKTS